MQFVIMNTDNYLWCTVNFHQCLFRYYFKDTLSVLYRYPVTLCTCKWGG